MQALLCEREAASESLKSNTEFMAELNQRLCVVTAAGLASDSGLWNRRTAPGGSCNRRATLPLSRSPAARLHLLRFRIEHLLKLHQGFMLP